MGRKEQQPRLSSGIPGLDDILAGGWPANHLYLIDGDPGTGKTTLAFQFLLEGAKLGDSVLYVTLSESRMPATPLKVSDARNIGYAMAAFLATDLCETALAMEDSNNGI
jgi:circadian clock protein KaiC